MTGPFGHYRIVDKLSEGGMGVVYRAVDERLGREVALKVLAPGALSDPDRRARFTQEARAASALNHPGIVTIHDVGAADGMDFIAMEFVRGKTLDATIPRKGMPVGEALRYGVQIADAMSCAHEAGIIHRDLKPANIIVGERGNVKVLDFGLAKVVNTGSALAATATIGETRALTGEGKIVGTVSYMSPEQAQGLPVDRRSDVFSLGSILYEMLAGRRPFGGDTSIATISAIVKDNPPPLRTVSQDIPPELERIVMRCLRKDPERRFQNMSDLKVALAELKEESDSGVLAAPAVERSRFRWGWVVGAAVLVATGAAGLTFWWRQNARTEAPKLTPVPLTSYTGLEYNPTLSPDGRQVAFSWDGPNEDNFDIYVKYIGSEPPLRLTTDPAPERAPSWSPDGRWIAFVRGDFDDKRELVVVAPIGGGERRIADLSVHAPFECAPSWSPDSTRLIVPTRDKADAPFALTAITVATGERTVISEPQPDSVGDVCGAASPDGKKFWLLSMTKKPGGGIRVASLDERLQLTGVRSIGDPKSYFAAWSSDSQSLVTVGPEGDSVRFWRVYLDGKRPREALPFGEEGFTPTISRTGNRLVYSRRNAATAIWQFARPMPGVGTRPPRRFAPSTTWDGGPEISPDGRLVVFASTRSGPMQIWMAAADASGAHQVTTDGGRRPAWFPDGSRVAFLNRDSVYTVPVSGGIPSKIDTGAGKASDAAVSRDGKLLYYGSDRSGRREVYAVPLSGGPTRQITTEGGDSARESPDGRYLVFFREKPDGTWLLSVPVKGGPERAIARVVAGRRSVAFAGNRVYTIPFTKPDAPGIVYEYDLDSGSSKPVIELPRRQRFTADGLALSPDGKWFLTALYDFDMDLRLIEGFK